MIRTALIGALLSTLALADVSGNKRSFDPTRTALLQKLGGRGGQMYYTCAFSPDGKYLAAGSLQGPIHVFKSGTWEKAFELDGHPGGVWMLTFSPDGRTIASGGQNGEVKLWEMAGRKELRALGNHPAMVWAMSYSPNGSRVVTMAMDGSTKIWNAEKGEEVATIQGTHPNSRSVVFAPDGGSFFCTMNDGSLRQCSSKDGSEVKTFETGGMPITTATVSKDGRTLFIGSMDGTIKAMDLASGKVTQSLSTNRSQQAMAMTLSSDGRYLLVGHWNTLKIFDTKTGRREAALKGHRSAIYSVSISTNGRWVASASSDGGLMVWGYKPSQAGSAAKGRGYLGVTVQTPPGGAGCVIQDVLAGTAAEKAGLQSGDLIIKVGDTAVNSYEEAVAAIGSHKESEEVEFLVERNGKQEKKKIKLGQHPEDQDPQEPEEQQEWDR